MNLLRKILDWWYLRKVNAALDFYSLEGTARPNVFVYKKQEQGFKLPYHVTDMESKAALEAALNARVQLHSQQAIECKSSAVDLFMSTPGIEMTDEEAARYARETGHVLLKKGPQTNLQDDE